MWWIMVSYLQIEYTKGIDEDEYILSKAQRRSVKGLSPPVKAPVREVWKVASEL